MNAANPHLEAAVRPEPISGSYLPEDCLFLLTPLVPEYVGLAEKEQLIQSGQRHYSEMVSFEAPPSEGYLQLFRELTARYKVRMAAEVMALARHILDTRCLPLTLVSLARAGTPVGTLLQRALADHLKADCHHYSISIIRDRGIDEEALAYILREQGRPASGVVFVDAWTAKGVITRELRAAIARWNHTQPEQLNPALYVLSDIGGTADVAATYEDYPIPSGILNATVSGLVSRSILNDRIRPGQFHGCIVYEHLREHDLTNWFLDEVSAQMNPGHTIKLPAIPREKRLHQTKAWIERWMRDHDIRDVNHIKPGIAEATRVMLRRVPERLLLSDPASLDVAHLQVLAQEKGVALEYRSEMPFNAAAFIKSLRG